MEKLLNEDLGIVRSTVKLNNYICDMIEDLVIDYIESDKTKFNDDILINFNGLKQNVYTKENLDDFIELPVEAIRIHLNCFKTKDITRKDGLNYDITGAALELKRGGGVFKDYSTIKKPSNLIPKYLTDEIDLTLVMKMEVDFMYDSSNFNFDNEIDLILRELKSIVFHELNHFYEDFNRHIQKPIKKTKHSLANMLFNVKGYGIPKPIFTQFQNLIYWIYYSSSWEINAMVHEAYPLIYEVDINELKETYIWKRLTDMKNFKAEDFYHDLLSVMEKSDPDSAVIEYREKLLLGYFKKAYKKSILEYSESDNVDIDNVKSIYQLAKKFERRINQSGEKLRRNILRLYVLKQEVDDQKKES